MEQGHRRLYKLKFTTTTQQNEINLSKLQSSNLIFTSLIILLKCTTSYISVLTKVKTIYCTPTLQSLLNIRSVGQRLQIMNFYLLMTSIFKSLSGSLCQCIYPSSLRKNTFQSQFTAKFSWAKVSTCRLLYWQSDGNVPQNCYCPHLGGISSSLILIAICFAF